MARKTVTDDFKIFSNRFSKLMKERNVTQDELACNLGIKRQTVSLYKNGQSTPDAALLKKIAIFFDVSSDWLLGLTGASKKTTPATDELKLSEDAIDGILTLPETERSVLSFLIEQETFSGMAEEMASHYVKGESFTKKNHLIRRIADFFDIVDCPNTDCYITDKGEIVNEWDLEEDKNYRCIPIETQKLINEAFLSDIKDMLVRLKTEYRKQKEL